MTASAFAKRSETPTEGLIDYCLLKKGAYVDYPFGPDFTILKVEGKIFAQFFSRSGQPYITLNCDRMTGDFYRQLYKGVVVRGYHCPAVQQPYFNTLPLSGEIENDVILEMIEHSYATVVGKLPKYKQRQLLE